jgi:hypothetical protein
METQILKVILETPWYDRAVSERFSFSLWCVNTSHSRSATKIEPGTSRGWSWGSDLQGFRLCIEGRGRGSQLASSQTRRCGVRSKS